MEQRGLLRRTADPSDRRVKLTELRDAGRSTVEEGWAKLTESTPGGRRVRRQLFDASELYRYWSATLPTHTSQRSTADEHRAICVAPLAGDSERAVELLSAHLNLTAERLEAVAASAEPNLSA